MNMGSTVVRFLSIATLFTICLLLCNANLSAPCKQNERQALLMFKHDLEDPSNRLSSWVGKGDCCNWTGVVCDNLTVHVRELHLAGHVDMLSGKINQSLLNLKHLTYLDLSNNDFQGMQIPSFLGSLKSLRYLNLSHSWFVGLIPHQLGNLTSLQVLDLGNPPYSEIYSLLEVESLQWISGLSQLQHLDMSGANLSKASDWLRVTNTLPSLVENLDMSFCGLYHIPGGIANMTNLKFLNLGYNSISSTIPKWLYRLSHLQSLSLSYNSFHGEISSSLGNLTSIVNLDLSFNQVAGNIPNSLGNLCKLTTLDMSENNLNGSVSEIFERFSRCSSVQIESLSLSWNNLSGHLTDKLDHFEKLRLLDLANNSISGPLPPSFGNLSCLEVVTIDDNNFTGVVSQLHFTNLTKLVRFEASGNSLTLETTPHWLPPFQLKILVLNSWHLEPSELPMWLQSQTQLQLLSMSNTRISGKIPMWIGTSLSNLAVLSLRSNQFHGHIPYKLCNLTYLQILDLAHNNLSGRMPRCLYNFTAMTTPDDTRLGFDPVIYGVGQRENANVVTKGRVVKYGNILLSLVISLDLSDNIISGEIPEELTSLIYLQSVNLSYNLLSGRIPPKIGDMRRLESLDLSMNQLCGQIAPSMSSLTFLSALNLSYNNLTGEIPKSTQLQSLDQSSFIGNKLCGPPLEVNCSNTNGTVPSVADQKHGGSDLLEDGWFYLSLGLGFLFGFWSVLGSLLLNLPWSIVFSRFQNSIVKKLYGVIVEYF
ncbi:LRR receptor-like serine/threonine-protein kinase GSO1 isoform X2 [Prunus persica]|uniref:LRR receptor-like serine/threonine-protein kinase GSO1 isoform X2 n=1 Tax=Prunus persica TaxID=3760 RepID=UPI0009AB3D87|nr:LRR receptor-like serine/threonine-protein kinase GSO1 isoform X2 [Prunus persica]